MEPKNVLSIDKKTGMVYVHKPVDFEEKQVLKVWLIKYLNYLFLSYTYTYLI